MSRFTCTQCGGTFTDPQPDGMAYYHVCPPGTAEGVDLNVAFDADRKLVGVVKPGPNLTVTLERDQDGNPVAAHVSGPGLVPA